MNEHDAIFNFSPCAIAQGGSVRVGLEDNFYLPGGEMARSNGELVGAARKLCKAAGRRAATVGEARQMLGIAAHV